MINARIEHRRAAPAWVALGAPLIGVPLLVGLLALAAPDPEPMEPESAVVAASDPGEALDLMDEAPPCHLEDVATTVEG